MTSKNAGRLAAALTLVVAGTACERGTTDLEPADFPSAASVFEDGFGPGVDFAAFEFSRVDALDIDNDEVYDGTASMRFDVPDTDDPSGGFVGGVFYSPPRDLSGYNALTFWAKSSRTIDVEEIGFGLDEAGNDRFQTALQGVRLTSSWQQFAIPIPGPASLSREGGLFYLSEANGAEGPYSIWFDEVAFANLPSVGPPQTEMVTRTVGMAVGDAVQAEIALVVPVGGELLDVRSSYNYFDWTSSDPAVATVSATGLITKVADGTAEITARLDGAPVPGAVTVEDGDGLAGVVFDDTFGAGIGFASFDPATGADPNAFFVDDTVAYQGNRSIRITVPGDGYAGGVFAVDAVENPNLLRDLSGFNALTFWAKAETAETLNEVGFGNDNTGTSRYIATRFDLPLTTDWQRYVIPIPDPARLTAEGGLFYFAENAENTIWFDEIAFQNLEEVGAAQPALVAQTLTLAVGDTARVQSSVSFPVDGESVAVTADPRYFAFSSADETIATVDESGLITMVGEGSTQISATLGDVAATGAVTVQSGAAAQIDLPITFDDPAVNYQFEDFGGGGPTTLEADPTDAGNTVARTVRGAGAVVFAGVTMTNPTGLATPIPFTESSTTMTVRVYSPDAGVPVRLKVENNGDPSQSVETEVVTTAANTWETLTFDFSNEVPDTPPLNPALTYDKATIFFDFGTEGAPAGEKVYLWDDVAFGGERDPSGPPSVPAPAPTQPAGDVISIYSDSYDDVPNAGFNRYGAAAFEEVDVAGSGNNALRYTLVDVQDGNFQIIELGGANVIDAAAAGMTNLRFDLYLPSVEVGLTEFDLAIVDIVPGNDPTLGNVRVGANSTPAIAEGQWLSFDVPLSEFTNLGGTSHIQQVVIDLVNSGEAYVDNIFFYAGDGSVGGPISLPITFDDGAVTGSDLIDFGNGGPSTLITDPTDGTNTVVQTIKAPGAETWAGVTMTGTAGLDSPIPFTASSTTMTVRVYSPAAGIPVRLKVEDNGDATRSVETEAVTTVANTWETLTFDFSNPATGTAALDLSFTYDKATIFFNFGTDGATAGEATYLWDDVAFGN